MGDHDRIPAELHKLRQDCLDLWCINYHIITDGGQFLNPVWDWHFRVYKSGEPVCDLPMLHFYRTDLYDLIFFRRKSGRLKIKYHISIIEILVFRGGNDIF